MRKRVIKSPDDASKNASAEWLDLERLAQVEVTSEEEAHPVEAALLLDKEAGWRAAEPGEQRIRILFDEPQKLRRIQLLFVVQEERTQEFTLRWVNEEGQTQEIARQQYNFSTGGTTRELEEYSVELEEVAVLELHLIPDISGGQARASLEQLRLA